MRKDKSIQEFYRGVIFGIRDSWIRLTEKQKNCKICMEVYTDALPLTGCTYEELREVEGF